MNKQEVFDKIATHLLTQNSAAYDWGCKYRTNDGRKCAIGCLIPDHLYDSNIEGLSLSGNNRLISILENVLGQLDDIDHKILRDLQDLHDSIHIEKWKFNLKIIAKRYNLMYNILDSTNE